MKLTLLKTSGRFQFYHENNGQRYWTTSYTILAPVELLNHLDSDYISKKLVWSEITSFKPVSLEIDLNYVPNTEYVALVVGSGGEDVDILGKLRGAFQDKVKISVRLDVACERCGPSYKMAEEVLTIDGDGICRGKSIFTCSFKSPNSNGLVSIEVVINLPHGHQRIHKAKEIAAHLRTNKRILEDGVASDIIIISKEGKEIKSHKNFLIASSTVLQAMFLSGLEEAQTSRIDKSDLSEEGVKAFLRYLYYGDKAGPEVRMDVAFEQLYAAHKYEVADLENFVTSYIVGIKDGEFTVKLAFKIYMFVRNIANATELKSKMVRVLQMKYDELKVLPEYKELFVKTPSDAMELCELFVKAPLKLEKD